MSSDFCPVPGSFQPFGVIFSGNVGEDSDVNVIMTLLVTTRIQKDVVVGFRFYPETESYLSPRSSTVTFVLRSSLKPGQTIQLEDGGRTLVLLKPLGPSYVLGSSVTPPIVRARASCFIFWVPYKQAQPEAIAAIGFDRAVLPPTCILPCEWATRVNIPVDADASQYMVYGSDNRLSIPSAWIHAYQLFKYAGASKWTAVDAVQYDTDVVYFRDNLYVSLVPAQLLPIAYRPHDVENEAFAATLVFVVTECVPARTQVWIVPNCSDENYVREEARWIWTSPECDLVPGSVINLTGLAWRQDPHASVGCIETVGTWPDEDFNITAFTLYSLPRQATNDNVAHAITALYPCSYACPIPTGLIPGTSMAASPWPDCASILPINFCRSMNNWKCDRLRLLFLCPARWLCQPLPKFRTAPRKEECACVETAAFMGVMSGPC